MGLVTWNTQGANPTAFLNSPYQGFAHPFNFIPDYICIQESGNAILHYSIAAIVCPWNPPIGVYYCLQNIKLGREYYNGYFVPWVRALPGNQRCSMAILWRAALGPHAAVPINGWNDGNPLHRPVFWIDIPGHFRVGCIHAPAGGNLGYILLALANVSVGAVNWLLAGDYNFNPPPILPPPIVLDTGLPTQISGGNLDYLIGAGIPYVAAARANGYIQSDHLQVRFV